MFLNFGCLGWGLQESRLIARLRGMCFLGFRVCSLRFGASLSCSYSGLCKPVYQSMNSTLVAEHFIPFDYTCLSVSSEELQCKALAGKSARLKLPEATLGLQETHDKAHSAACCSSSLLDPLVIKHAGTRGEDRAMQNLFVFEALGSMRG